MKRLSILLSLAIFSLAINSYEQNSGVSGTVLDSSGVLIPGVTVTATNNQTNASTNGQLQGDYFGVGNLVKVDDPQCALANVADTMGNDVRQFQAQVRLTF
jgi:hypothetical protein